MELTNVEIGILITYYEGELDYCGYRIDQIHKSDYDQDLKDAQIERIKENQKRSKTRIEELKKLRKEL